MLAGTDNCVHVVFVWEETRVLGGNPPVLLGDHMTISHKKVLFLKYNCVNVYASKYCN